VDEVKTGAIVSATVAIAGGLYKFIQWLVTAALASAERSNDRLEEEVHRAHEAAREARAAAEAVQLRLSDIERENALLRAENAVLKVRLERIESKQSTKE
jgi:hypothetical protein